MDLYTDASDTGYGAYWNGQWFNTRWTSSQVVFSIAWRELYAILVVCATWGHLLVWLECPHLMSLVRHLFLLAAMGNYHVGIAHLPGVDNCIANHRSRFSMQAFKQVAPRRSTRAHSNLHPCMADGSLTAWLYTLQQLGVAPSPRCTYQVSVTRFNDFCMLYSLPSLPTSSLTPPLLLCIHRFHSPVAVTAGLVRLCETLHCIHWSIYQGTEECTDKDVGKILLC